MLLQLYVYFVQFPHQSIIFKWHDEQVLLIHTSSYICFDLCILSDSLKMQTTENCFLFVDKISNFVKEDNYSGKWYGITYDQVEIF